MSWFFKNLIRENREIRGDIVFYSNLVILYEFILKVNSWTFV